jgi:hypothetical protein
LDQDIVNCKELEEFEDHGMGCNIYDYNLGINDQYIIEEHEYRYDPYLLA